MNFHRPLFALAVATFICAECSAQTLEAQLLAESRETLAADARKLGDPTRGAAIFFAKAMACSTCHSVGDRDHSIGPDITKLDPKINDVALVESVLEPSKSIAPAYAAVTIALVDGRLISGLPVEETETQLVLRDATQPERLITLKKTEIEERQTTKQSIMPTAQVNQLPGRQQFLDLIRYLIDLREGGVKRARELQPPADPYVQIVPDRPLPWQPVVQRGLITVDGGARYPRGIALGFAGGTLVFDANQLAPVAIWHGGFVKSTPQNYFGLDFSREGENPEKYSVAPLRFQFPNQEAWQTFESPTTSDPNSGSRFDGYQIGRSSIRLHYRVLVGNQRITVTEDVRVETRVEWQGVARELRLSGLPTGSRVAVALPQRGKMELFDAAGEKVETADGPQQAPLLMTRAKDSIHVVRAQSSPDAKWLSSETKDGIEHSVSVAAAEGKAVVRIDAWKYTGRTPEPAKKELAALVASPPALDDAFDQPRQPSSLPLLANVKEPTTPVVQRAPVKPAENIDEFPAARTRHLRFVVTRTSDNSEPGLDELEVYGPDAKDNLALKGKASASSVINGYAIHQIPHLNDGLLGNKNSWISSEKGGGWAQIEFPEAVEVSKIVWARDRTGVCRDRLPVAYRIEVSDDGQTWKKVGDEAGRAPPEQALGVIRRDASPGYVMESIPLPFPSCRPSDLVFSNDGVLYAIALTEGQIWRTRVPPVGHPERVNWQRYATGLHHALGLAHVNGRLFVAHKPEITEVIDRDGDGTADHYHTLATGWGLNSGWHEYCFGLAVDKEQHLWFALNTGHFWTHPDAALPGRLRGSILRVGLESEKMEEMATGCRVPNGIATGFDGNIFFTDNQGDWIQVCKLAHVVPGRFYGHPEAKENALQKETYPEGRSAVWMPYSHSRSTSGPVCDLTGGKFGPFQNQIFVGDVGYGANAGLMRIALEKVKGEYQGACFRFIDGQPLGCERMKFGPDNQLYSASLTSGITRVAFDGKQPFAIEGVKIRPRGEGFVVHLTKPLGESMKIEPAQFRMKQYHYVYSGNYGSPIADEKAVAVKQVEVSADRKSITLTLPVESYPIGMVYEMNLGKLVSRDDETLQHNEAWYTVQQIPD